MGNKKKKVPNKMVAKFNFYLAMNERDKLKQLIRITLILSVLSAAISKWWFSIITLNGNQINSLFSTLVPAIIGIFGLLLSGYFFYRNSIKKTIEKDLSYERILTEFGKKTFTGIIIVGGYGLVSIFLSLLCIAFNDGTGFFFNILLNISGIFIFFTLITIFFTIYNMLHPDCKKDFCLNVYKEMFDTVNEENIEAIEEYEEQNLIITGYLSKIYKILNYEKDFTSNPFGLIKLLVVNYRLSKENLEKFQIYYYQKSIIEIAGLNEVATEIIDLQVELCDILYYAIKNIK